MTLGALADPTKWAALPPILVKPWNTLTSDFDPWIHFMFPLDGLHTLHMDWMSHHSCTEDVQVAPPTHTHARKDQAPHLGIGPTYHEGGGVGGPPSAPLVLKFIHRHPLVNMQRCTSVRDLHPSSYGGLIQSTRWRSLGFIGPHPSLYINKGCPLTSNTWTPLQEV
jgi:hypothetical protein